MPHLHLSLQAGDDLVLKRMKRRHSRAQALALCRRARDLRPGIALGADLIAGFPTEDEAMFAAHARFRRRGGARLSPCLSVQPAARHARRAHAASAARDRPRARGTAARGRRAALAARARRARRHRGRGAGRARRVSGAASITRRCGSTAPPKSARVIAAAKSPRSDGAALVGAASMSENGGGWFQRLKAGLARSSRRLSDGITAIVGRRRLDDRDARGAGGAADRRRSRARRWRKNSSAGCAARASIRR